MRHWPFLNSTGDRGNIKRGDIRHWHFLRSTCDIRTPRQRPRHSRKDSLTGLTTKNSAPPKLFHHPGGRGEVASRYCDIPGRDAFFHNPAADKGLTSAVCQYLGPVCFIFSTWHAEAIIQFNLACQGRKSYSLRRPPCNSNVHKIFFSKH